MKTHKNDVEICKSGCIALWNISEASPQIQKDVCEKGGLSLLLDVLKMYKDDKKLLGSCCGAIGVILSSQENHSRFFTPKVLNCVRECYERHRDSEKISQFFLGLTRAEDPRVSDAVSRGVCTKEAFPKCSDDCKCDENVYCPKCCVQQKAFRCHTCDKERVKLYCETCRRKDHQGHDCDEFFYSVRCGTK